MSITASYRRLPFEEFQGLRDDPTAAESYFGEDIDVEDDEAQDAYYTNLEESGRYLDIGKLWHGLHYLLTGKAEMDKTEVPPPLGNVVLGGTSTQWEATYGMVRYLMPQEVKEVANALEHIEEMELRQGFDPTAFQDADIYPGGEVWAADGIEELLDAFVHVRDFFSEAARRDEVVLLSSD